MSFARYQRGTAIIMALFLTGFAALIAVTLMGRLSRDLRRTDLLLNSIQAELYAQGSVLWALDSLHSQWLHQKKNDLVDHLPRASPVDQINNFTISSRIDDAQARFNLNNVSSEEGAAYFQRLLLRLDPKLSSDQAKTITNSLCNWISPLSRDIDEDLYYTRLPQPYRVPHRFMASASELSLIKGVTPQLYTRLVPYIIALPESTPINVNTAAAPLLQSLSSSLSAEGAKAIEAYRQISPFVSTEEFLNMDLVHNHAISASLITVTSQYFLGTTLVETKRQQLRLFSLIQRIPKGSKALVRIVWQSKGEL